MSSNNDVFMRLMYIEIKFDQAQKFAMIRNSGKS